MMSYLSFRKKVSIPTVDLIFLALSAYLRVLYVSSNEQVDGLTKEKECRVKFTIEDKQNMNKLHILGCFNKLTTKVVYFCCRSSSFVVC